MKTLWFASAAVWVLLLDARSEARRPWGVQSSAAKRYRGGASETSVNDDVNGVLQDIRTCISKGENLKGSKLVVPKDWKDVEEAIDDFAASTGDNENVSVENRGFLAWNLLRGLAESDTFVRNYWHRQPLLLRAADIAGISSSSSSWVEGAFTLERDLKQGVDQSFIAGHRTADILRNGTKTDTWLLEPLRSSQSASTPSSWRDVKEALQRGTIYFNTAGSLWPSLGALCRIAMFSFGFPANCNVYVTPLGCQVSVPPHTDRQDVLVFQTQGYKRWRVFAPPKRTKGGRDPLDRGKQGDILSLDELGAPLLDTVIGPGDVMYVPAGFPHTTDTSNTDQEDTDDDKKMEEKTSVHLTMGIDTHVWMLTMAHLRWALLQRCGLDFRIEFENDDDYWAALRALPIGFLSKTVGASLETGLSCWQATVDSLQEDNGVTEEFLDLMVDNLQEMLIRLEPNRWKAGDDHSCTGKVRLPPRQEMKECISYMVAKHWRLLLDSQIELSQVERKPKNNEEVIVKAFKGTQRQDLIMENLGLFCKSEAMSKMYAQRRMMAQAKTKGLSL
jgi:hypothetical protein